MMERYISGCWSGILRDDGAEYSGMTCKGIRRDDLKWNTG